MANLKKKIQSDRERDRDQIEDWMNSPAGGVILGSIVLALGAWAVISWIIG